MASHLHQVVRQPLHTLVVRRKSIGLLAGQRGERSHVIYRHAAVQSRVLADEDGRVGRNERRLQHWPKETRGVVWGDRDSLPCGC